MVSDPDPGGPQPGPDEAPAVALEDAEAIDLGAVPELSLGSPFEPPEPTPHGIDPFAASPRTSVSGMEITDPSVPAVTLDAAEPIDLDSSEAVRVSLGDEPAGADDTQPSMPIADLGGAKTVATPRTGHRTMDTDPALQAQSPELVRRQLEAARAENAALLRQLAHLESSRTDAMSSHQDVMMLRAQLVNALSERDMLLELYEDSQSRAAVLQQRVHQSEGSDGEDVETLILQQELEGVLAETEALRAEVERLRVQAAGHVGGGASVDETAALEGRIENLEASLRAAEKMGTTADEEVRTMVERHTEIARELSRAEGERDEARERADRLKVALERMRAAFMRASEEGKSEDALEERAKQAEEETVRERDRAEELDRALAAARERSLRLEGKLERAREAAEKASLAGASSEETEALARDNDRLASDLTEARGRIEEFEQQALELQNQVTELTVKVSEGAGTSDATVKQLRAAMMGMTATMQAYMLEIEGSKGTIARSQQEVQRHGRSVNSLAQAIGHLSRYLGTGQVDAQHAANLLQEVKRHASELRALVETNERFGASMHQTMDRLTAIVSTSSR